MKPSLRAELRCPSASPHIRGLGQQGIVVVPEGSLRTAVPLLEGAEAAVLVADVCEIQIAVHHIGDRLTHKSSMNLVGNCTQAGGPDASVRSAMSEPTCVGSGR